MGLELAISNPCVELFGILLHEVREAWIHRDDAQRRLREVHPGYDHEGSAVLDVRLVQRGLDDARGRAARLNQLAVAAGDPLRNPTTGVPRAIDALIALAG